VGTQVVYRTIAGAPIRPEMAITFRQCERAPAVNVFPDCARRLEAPA
jgi:hypothetical protein